MQSPGQPAVVQQVQLVQPKPESQVVQIPQQALKVVQAASATLPPVPQRQSAPPSLQVTPTEPTPTQVLVGCNDPLLVFQLNPPEILNTMSEKTNLNLKKLVILAEP